MLATHWQAVHVLGLAGHQVMLLQRRSFDCQPAGDCGRWWRALGSGLSGAN
jgi:hypothetical protein